MVKPKIAVFGIVGGAVIVLIALASYQFLFKPTNISAVIVPHHDVVANERLETLKEVSKSFDTDPTIVLISPNHYDSGRAALQLYDEDFTTKNGDVPVNERLTEKAVSFGAEINNPSFRNEHGIKLVLPDIAEVFPESEILPVIVRNDSDEATIDNFIKRIAGNCEECLMIASVDFSHYQPFTIAQFHDRDSIYNIETFDYENITTKNEIGSPITVRSAMIWAEAHETKQFNLFKHTDSTEIANSLFAEGTSHVMGWFESGEPKQKTNRTSFTAVGDIMFEGEVKNLAGDNYPGLFDKLGDRVLWGSQYIIGNLEGPIISDNIDFDEDDPKFSFEERSIEALEYLKFTHMNLNNNHTGDAGEEGVESTIGLLNKSGINGLHTSVTTIPGDDYADITTVDANNTNVNEIMFDDTKFNIVYVHWGIEGDETHSPQQSDVAHTLIDFGADIVIGTGTHTVQDAEIYKEKPIIYSLGNFIFDQSYNADDFGMILFAEQVDGKITLMPYLVDLSEVKPKLIRSHEGVEIIKQKWNALSNYISDERGGIIFTLP